MAANSGMTPLVSVLMTAYNREKYIGSAMESVLNSGYKNLELIIVDDGSKDNTVEIARGYADKDPRVRVYINEKNLGDYPNRNQAAAYANGKYLKYVDADDYIYPWGLGLLVDMMEAFPSAGWGLCSLEQYVPKPFPFQLSPKEAYEFHYLGPGLFHKAPLSSIIRTDAFRSVGGFAPIRMAGDFEMWHRLGQKYPVVLMPHGIVWYREHDAQEMNSHRKFIRTYVDITLKYFSDASCPLDKPTVQKILRAGRRSIYKEVLKGALTLNTHRIADNWIRLNQYRHASKDRLFS
ncbi:MAG TPA: glycosyltransferase family 2 protein [Puia sp.]|jgi:glycosyltransferase involved in cell wall biosynthesis|nr:glycosyltransferase family 2 protein [Puia sp.]